MDEAVTSKSTSKGENICETSTPNDEAEDEDSQISEIAMPAAPCREGVILQQSTVKKFGFNELKRATGDFHKDYLLGMGGFGPVFMGWVDEHTLEPSEPGSGMVVAVKMLGEEAYQGHSQWLVF